MENRKAFVFFKEDSSITLLKPYSDEYKDCLIVIGESAYGEFTGIITPITEIKTKLNITDEEINKLIVEQV